MNIEELYERLWEEIKDNNWNNKVVVSWEWEPLKEWELRVRTPTKNLVNIYNWFDWEHWNTFLDFKSKKEIQQDWLLLKACENKCQECIELASDKNICGWKVTCDEHWKWWSLENWNA